MNNVKRYISAADVCARFGVTDMTLWRWLKDETLGFPKPLVIRRRRLFDLAEIEAFEEHQRATARVA